MAEKFNGFSHDDILKITGMKEGSNGHRPQSAEAVKQALRNQPGIRRMPDKNIRQGQADQLRKQPQAQAKPQQVAPAAKKTTTKSGRITPTESTAAPTPNTDAPAQVSLNLERPLSDSLVEALYCGKASAPSTGRSVATTATYAEAGAATSVAVASGDSSEATLDDSSILKISNSKNGTTSSDDAASILPSTKDSSREGLNTDSPFKGVSLQDFEQQRKMIQEQNKQKKQMLYQAIEQHTQKTAAESRKIEEIRHELSKLENDLAVDVAMLRKQIDNACIHFANVEKQYVRIEAQFLKAKVDLHNASEKKELLTEHLCTVIAHNEDRKAQKLTELMQKVGLAPTDEPPTSPPQNLSES
ncbi:RAB6-interacting golgin [Drosophila obscura]|uniref:RAB6-interacting golgin n=1 Tax=Drosophila obscura TaxID=7282 RepID=UPI001BB15ED4|nr:RAB6-interacting golgin [Drosophila obscura]